MPLFEKPLKILPEELKPYSWPYKNLLEKRTQPDIFNQPEKRVRITEIATNIGDLEVKNIEVVLNIITTS